MNRRAKFDDASFVLGGEIRNRTNKKHTNSSRYQWTWWTKYRGPKVLGAPEQSSKKSIANGLQNAYSDDFGSNVVSKLRSFRREFNTEIAASEPYQIY